MYFFLNNKFYQESEFVISCKSKAFQYGELVFETIKCYNSKLLFFQEHFNRLEAAANLLKIYFPQYFTSSILQLHINSLLQKNNLSNAKVKVSIYKENGNLFSNDPDSFNVLIETIPLENSDYCFNQKGLTVCLYEDFKKNSDLLSNYKTGNHLQYVLAAKKANANNCNEAILFNNINNVCDSTISNVFIIKNRSIITPPNSDGCINGIMKKYLLENDTSIKEQSITKEDLLNADEVFLTNTIRGIQWVHQIEDKICTNTIAKSIFEKIIKPLNKV